MSYDGYMNDLKETMELVQGSLQTIVREQKKELESDEEYQHQFYKLCNDIGVDPFAQKKGLFSGLFKKDLNDFYRKLGIRVLAYCNKTRFQNGGLIRVSDIETYLKEHPVTESVVIADPPRSGLGKAVSHSIGKSSTSRMVYVSCNPITQKEDIDILKNYGFAVQRIVPVDMFCFTEHVENIILLTRTK